MQICSSRSALVIMNGAIVLSASVASAAPSATPAFSGRLTVKPISGSVNQPSQIAFGPDGRLYVARAESEIISFAFNPQTKLLSDQRGTGVAGMGVAFANHAVIGNSTPQNYMYVSHRVNGFEAYISRYGDSNGNFAWGETGAGETNVDIVRGVPLGDHSANHLQITQNNTLYVGIGARTINGRNGNNTGGNFHDEPHGPVPGGGIFGGGEGFTLGETSYNGTISWIQNLSLVANSTSAAQLRDGPNGTSGALLAGRDAFLPGAPHATKPFTSTAPDKLIVHSAGTRNPFGLALNRDDELWFTNNHGRADTNGDGTSNPHFNDLLDDDLSNDVGDQFFQAQPGGDYRYDNWNFRDNPAFPDSPVISNTFDNLDKNRPGFNVLHDPEQPNGLGPSSSANGLEFVKMDMRGVLPGGLREYGVLTRWSDLITETPPGTDELEYRDIVIVDPTTGAVAQALRGFANPIDVLRDPSGGFLVADFGVSGAGSIYHVSVRGLLNVQDKHVPIAVPEPAGLIVLFVAGFARVLSRRRLPKIARLAPHSW